MYGCTRCNWRGRGLGIHLAAVHSDLSLEERLSIIVSVRVNKVPGGCWEWTGAKSGSGYGQLHTENNGSFRAHRVAAGLFTPGDGVDDVVMHLCDNPVCVNPEHLRVGSQSENIRDAVEKGRHWSTPPEDASPLTEGDVIKIKHLLAGGLLYREIAERFPVSEAAIAKIAIGRRWSSVPDVGVVRHVPPAQDTP